MAIKSRYTVDTVFSVNPYNSVLSYLKKKSQKNNEVINMLLFDWRATEQVIRNMALFLPESIKKDEVPIIYSALQVALNRYSKVLFVGAKPTYYPHIRLAVFIDSLLGEVAKHKRLTIQDVSGNSWRLDSKRPFHKELAISSGAVETVLSRFEGDRPVKQSLYENHIDEKIKIIMRKYDHEQAILGDRNLIVS